MSEPTPSHPTRVLAFSGPVAEFLDRLAQWVALSSADPQNFAHADAYDWELTCSVARHPAGKGFPAPPAPRPDPGLWGPE